MQHAGSKNALRGTDGMCEGSMKAFSMAGCASNGQRWMSTGKSRA